MLQRLMVLSALVACVTVSAGCMSSAKVAPGVGFPLGAMSTTATYDVLGDTEGSSTGGILFGIFPIGCEKKSGCIATGSAMPAFPPKPVEDAAVYNAIEAVPGADALFAPRFNIEQTNYIVYKKKTVNVKGKAIRINSSVR